MEKLVRVQGRAATIPRSNIDTDMIIRIERLSTIPRSELGKYAFESLRRAKDGSLDPAFPLNASQFDHAPILMAGPNFGCGSSREGAVWALVSLGIRCLIAPSFGDIFFNNCFQNGVLPIVLDERHIRDLTGQCTHGASLTVDLETQEITAPDGSRLAFEVDQLKREALMEGLDDIEQTLKRDTDIRRWQAMDHTRRPWVWKPLAQPTAKG